MLEEITRDNLSYVRNPVFRDYASMYLEIYEGFLQQVEQYGLPFRKDPSCQQETNELLTYLKTQPEVIFRNDASSLVYRRISPACEACTKGVNTVTCAISFKCHRSCFFCFNPNQDNYEAHIDQKQDWKEDLDRVKRSGGTLSHIALTGGEPLLFPEDTIAFFTYARELYPSSHLRLYTSGDLLTRDYLFRLKAAGLDEIRFSYKMEDQPRIQEKVLSNMSDAKEILPCVMVEMPVMPDCEEEMKTLLCRLDEIGIWSINLLELCFPYNNAQAFAARDFQLRYPPYRTLYNFWYAGGLPVAGSELVALRLMKYAVENKLTLGVHYCSLENKNFGQMYQQNYVYSTHHSSLMFSEKDYYLKTVKAFGTDAVVVKRLFDKRGITDYIYNTQGEFIQFHPKYAAQLKGRGAELALSVNVMEFRDNEFYVRELKLLRADLGDLDPSNM